MSQHTRSVAEIVLDSPAAARVFQSHRIDFCCRGHLTLAEACAERRVDPEAVIAELDAVIGREDQDAQDMRRLSTAQLIEHIQKHHHDYLREAMPFLVGLSAKVARVHGDRDPRLRTLFDVVRQLTATLEPHLRREEEVLFPALIAGGSAGAEPIERELRDMFSDHLQVADLLERIRDLAGDFAIPEDACNSHRTLLAELAALEADIIRHVHLENHVLMPRFA